MKSRRFGQTINGSAVASHRNALWGVVVLWSTSGHLVWLADVWPIQLLADVSLSNLEYGTPSLIRLQLIRMSDNPDRNMENEKVAHS
jgi:hypothetical protein